MAVLYKVLNPGNGSYSSHEGLDECFEQIIKVAYAFYVSHTHNIPFSIVTVNSDGSETWRSPDGKDMPSPEESLNMMRNALLPEFIKAIDPNNETVS